ncbi:WD40 repeat-containing protein, putative [Bodo saltans]|uniref:WD40 repeat-containing protein, putative n=1 Tax=Bodo saltans TaxID=75058 RepID=A0A0S4JLC7_BODSA|nr:WD40 repeat-containing protein, putative [Bodo saltans]|eukprot:CUG90941.1 WD40 repeat-containing protein, putative [Bodo saltans]
MDIGNIDSAADLLFGDGAEDTVPQDITCQDDVFDIAFHPSAPFLAIGMISGTVDIHEYKGPNSKYILQVPNIHTAGITGMEFTETGSHLVTVSSDKSINVLDCSTQQSVIKVKAGKSNPHKHGVSSVNICSEVLVATGDDDGLIALWDMREQKPVGKYHEHGDTVFQMLFFSEVNQIVSCSGDTCLGVYDLRMRKIVDYSVKRNDELTCIAFIPETDGIICGTPNGSLPMWKYGSWTRPFDVFDNHPKECDTIMTYNDNIVMTGACDGVVRVIQVFPVKRNLCHLGGNTRRQGISKIRCSHDRNMIAVSGTDKVVQFIDISFLADDQQLDKLRSKAEQRHLATLREATDEAEEIALREKMAEAEEDSDWSDADSEMDSSEDEDDSDKEEGEEGEDNDNEEEAAPQKTARQVKRERVAAAKWLKDEKRKTVNFQYERKRRRVQGFWGDLNSHEDY